MAIEYRTDLEYWERLDGVDYPKVSPKTTHALVQGAFVALLRELTIGRGFCGTEWRFRIGSADGTDSWLVPDIAFVSTERMSLLPRANREEPPFAPDIAIEVRSPSHRSQLFERKVARYLNAGSLLVLDVDPETRAIYAHDASGMRPFASGMLFEYRALPWLKFDVTAIFSDLADD